MRVSDERTKWLGQNVFPHEPAIRAWLRRRLVQGLEIDDVIHDMYAKLVALPSIEQIESPRRYAFRIAYSIVVDHVRRARISPVSAVQNIEQLDIPAPEASMETRLEQRDELASLSATLATLPPLCREAFLLRRLEGLSQRETAARLRISEKTVEKYMTKSVRLIMDVFGRGGKSVANPSYLIEQPITRVEKRE